MENMNYQTVSVKPEKAERRYICRQYAKTAFVILINILLFNVVLRGAALLICAAAGGGIFPLTKFSENAQKTLSNDDLSTVISCLIPIISETVSIFLGIKILKLDLKKLFTRSGFTGGELARDCSICLGLQTLAALVAAAIGYIFSLFDLEAQTIDLSAQSNSAWSLILMYFYACLLGPVLEELLYRGVILQSMRKYNERFAIVLSALIFGLMHQNYQQFILAFMLGLVLAAVDLKANSLVPSMVIHIIVNTSGVVMQLALQSADYEAFGSTVSGDMSAALSGSTAFMVLLVINALFRYGVMFLGIALLVMVMIKGGNVRKPTPAGKSRGVPMLLRSPLWYVIFAAYFYLCFIYSLSAVK